MCADIPCRTRLDEAGATQRVELEPWSAEQGPAVFWVAGIVSDLPGVAAKCLCGILDQIDSNPNKNHIDMAGMICTGPQGYLMSQAFDMKETGTYHQGEWPFMERQLRQSEVDGLGATLQEIWTMTKAKDVVRKERERWGNDWRTQTLTGMKAGFNGR